MKPLKTIFAEIYYKKKIKSTKSEKDVYIKHYKLTIVHEEPNYTINREQQIFPAPELKSISFDVDEASYKEMVDMFTALYNADETTAHIKEEPKKQKKSVTK